MDSLRLVAFKVNGQDSGSITSPCGGPVLPIYIELSGMLKPAETPSHNVPIWIGERHWYWDQTLIRAYVTFSGSPGVALKASVTFNLQCSQTCELTPSGPVPASFVMFPPGWFLLGFLVNFWKWVWMNIGRIINWFSPPYVDFTEYVVDGNSMVLSAGFFDEGNVPLFRWWYGQKTVTVRCGVDDD